MRCRYCGADRPLLKKISPDAEFCTEAHRRQFQEDCDCRALNRPIQAQAQTSARAPAPPVAPSPAAQEEALGMAGPAGFVPQQIAPAGGRHLLGYDAKPLRQRNEAVLPGGCRVSVLSRLDGALALEEIVPEEAPPPGLTARYIPFDPGPPRRGNTEGPERLLGNVPFSWRVEFDANTNLDLKPSGLDLGQTGGSEPPSGSEAPQAPPDEEKPWPEARLTFLSWSEEPARCGDPAHRAYYAQAASGTLGIHMPKVASLPLRMRVAWGSKPNATQAVLPAEPEEDRKETLAPRPAGKRRFPGRLFTWLRVLIVLAGCAGLAWHQFSGSRTAKVDLFQGAAGWVTVWAQDSEGSAYGRQMSLYEPSMNGRDYKLEFAGRIGSKALGWVIRHADSHNYYLMKLEILRPGENPVVKLIRYAVVNGEAREHVQVNLLQAEAAGADYIVSVEVRGSRIVTAVRGQVVDEWNDSGLREGAAGFYRDRGETAVIEHVKFTTLGE